jgi:multidrug efflux pump subunit AcrB
MNGIIAWMARNGVAANLLMMLLVITGLFSIASVTVKVFPETTLDVVSIRVAYPGASPVEIEESIIRRIEEKIESVEEIQEIRATASEGLATLNVELVRGADTQKRLDEIKSQVDQITTFPVDAEQPQISQASNQQRALQLIVTGNTSERQLKELAYRIRDELTFMPQISIVEISGARDYEISIEASNDSLRNFGITLNDLSTSIRRESLELPGGSLETSSEELVLRTLGRNYERRDFENIVVTSTASGSRVLLSDIATVRDGFAETDLVSLYNGVTSVAINVMRVGNEQVLDIEKAILDYLDTLRPTLPEGINVSIARNDAQIIRDRLSILFENALMGLVLVVITLALFLELKIAFWTSMGILITFTGVFTIMVLTDTSLNVLSSIGFLLAIGLVVDDAIVVGENIFTRMEAGMSPMQAAIRGAQRIAIPVIFAISTTVAAFAALLSLPGTLGALLGDIPKVVIAILFLSLVEALLILPYHLSATKGLMFSNPFTRPIEFLQHRISAGFDRLINGPLHRSLVFATTHPWVVICSGISLLMLTAGILGGGYVKFNFFPTIEGEYVTASVELPTGATLERTELVVRRLEAAALEVGREMQGLLDGDESVVQSITLLIGTQDSGQANPLGSGGGLAQANVATVAVELIPPEQRSFPTGLFETNWRNRVGPMPETRKLTFSSQQVAFGDPIRVELTAGSDATLDRVIPAVEEQLRSINGVFDVRNERDTGKREITFRLKPEARSFGLTLESMALQIRAAFFGDEALRVQRGREDVRVYVRLPKEERSSLSDLENYRIRTPGGFVPLREVAEIREGVSPSSIQRRDGRRIIAVTGNIDLQSLTSNEVNAFITDTIMPPLQAQFPDLTYDFGGEQREQARTAPAIASNFLFALIAIYALLAIAFKSYVQPLIVMTAIPFGVVGAIMGHLLMGMNLSLLSIFGIIGLSGVVINGALVMIDFINEERHNGMEGVDAIIQGAKNRVRPIFLTSLTTFLGVGPLIFETSVQAQFLIPVALSLGFGVLFGTVIQIFLVPALMSLYGAPKMERELDSAGQVIEELQGT